MDLYIIYRGGDKYVPYAITATEEAAIDFCREKNADSKFHTYMYTHMYMEEFSDEVKPFMLSGVPHRK